MGVRLPHPSLGIIIPCFLIEFIGHSCHYFIFQHYFSVKKQIYFELSIAMIWTSYYIAIYSDPGTAPKDYQPDLKQWKRWCKKCEAFKPERSHHCKTCKKCILKMDHHCPWTANCVGYKNMPHFMRFLVWVEFVTGWVFTELIMRGAQLWDERNYPAYMFDTNELVFLILNIILDGFVFLSVGLLFLKCVIHIVSGFSQIETWEWERIESQITSERFWNRIRENYSKLHGVKMPMLKSIRSIEYFHYKNTKNSDHFLFSIDDIVFPYDIGFLKNLSDQLNYPWFWLLPWAGPLGDGINFEITDLLSEDQLSLPWPPDGGNQGNFEEEGETIIYKGRRDVLPKDWVNDMGESLNDYGVDVELNDEKL